MRDGSWRTDRKSCLLEQVSGKLPHKTGLQIKTNKQLQIRPLRSGTQVSQSHKRD